MSTSYIENILFLMGIFLFSSVAFTQVTDVYDPKDSSAYLDCSPKPGGVPVGVIILGLSELQRKDKKHYVLDIIDKENKESKGTLDCRPAGYPFGEAQTRCPIGQFRYCAKNSADSPNPNGPKELPDNAPRGTEHGFIRINADDAKHGLRKGLEREGFYNKGFADTADDYTNCINRNDRNDDGLEIDQLVCNADGDWNYGRFLKRAQSSSGPKGPVIQRKVAAPPPELYTNKTPDQSDCLGNLNCAQAQGCQDLAGLVFGETCGPCANLTLGGCSKDYDNFCRAGGGVNGPCGNGQVPTDKVPPPNMAALSNSAVAAIEDMKKATKDFRSTDKVNYNFNQCGLLKIVNMPISGQSFTPNKRFHDLYTSCASGDPSHEAAFEEINLNYLETVLKAFADPGHYAGKPFKPVHLQTLSTALAKLASTDASDAFKAMGVSNPTPDMLDAYKELADAIALLVGTTAASQGTVLQFAIGTKGGQGYLGITPAGQQNSAMVSGAYQKIIDNMDEKPSCLQSPTYTTQDNKVKYLKAIIRDHAIAQAIYAGLATCPPEGEANVKPRKHKNPTSGK